MKKRRIIFYVMLLFLLSTIISMITGCELNKDIHLPKAEKGIYIYDNANIIDSNAKTRLNSMLMEVDKKTGIEFLVVSVENVEGMDFESYAKQVFGTMAIEQNKQSSRVLIFISKTNKKVRIEVGTGIEKILSESKRERILSQYFFPYSENGAYTDAIENTTKVLAEVIAKEYKVDINGLEYNASDNTEFYVEYCMLVVILGFIFLILMLDVIVWPGHSSNSSNDFSDNFPEK